MIISSCNNVLEFLKTMSSVILGGFITYATIWMTERRKDRKSISDKKNEIYTTVYTSIRSLIRYEIAYLEENVIFKYHVRICDLESKQTETYILHKEQAHYHQKQMTEIYFKLIETASTIDKSSIDYHIYYGEDNEFDEIITKIVQWDRPVLDNFNVCENMLTLNIAFSNAKELVRKVVYDSIGLELIKLVRHIKR